MIPTANAYWPVGCAKAEQAQLLITKAHFSGKILLKSRPRVGFKTLPRFGGACRLAWRAGAKPGSFSRSWQNCELISLETAKPLYASHGTMRALLNFGQTVLKQPWSGHI
jgi:hypothetical protein